MFLEKVDVVNRLMTPGAGNVSVYAIGSGGPDLAIRFGERVNHAKYINAGEYPSALFDVQGDRRQRPSCAILVQDEMDRVAALFDPS